MKLNTLGKLNSEFGVKRVKTGQLNAGGVFLYRRRLWIVLNPCQHGGGKVVRTLEGAEHVVKMLPSKTLVWRIDTVSCSSVIKVDRKNNEAR